MTNREKLNAMTNEELSDLFCKMMEKIAENSVEVDDWCCNLCPFTKKCEWGHPAILAYLNEEADDAENV